MLVCQANFTNAAGASGRSVPKLQAGIPVSPGTVVETNLDVSVEEIGPASVDEGVVQEAKGLQHVSAPFLPFKAEVEAHNVSHLPLRSWCSPQDDMKTKEEEQPEDSVHDTLPVLTVRDRKSKGISSHPVPSKCVTDTHTLRKL